MGACGTAFAKLRRLALLSHTRAGGEDMTKLKLVMAGILVLVLAAPQVYAQFRRSSRTQRSAPTQTFPRQQSFQSSGPRDPGVRGTTPAAGAALTGLTASETAFFDVGLEDFTDEDNI